MRILQMGKFFPPDNGGMESFLLDLVGELSQKIKCDVLCFNSKNETVRENKGNYVVTRTASFGKLFSVSVSPAMIYWLKKTGKQYNLIHLHLPNPMAVLAYFLVRPKTKLILHWHSDVVRQKELLFFYKPLQNWLFKKADRIIATSSNYMDGSKYLQKHKNRCVSVSLGISALRLKSDERKLKKIKEKYKDKPIVFSLGRLIYYKGFECLIEAMKQIDGYLLIGGTGELEDKFKKMILDLGLEKRVFLLGKIKKEDLGSYYQACDVFCLPSIKKSEAFGLVIVEAMSFGKPIVSTDIKDSGVSWVNQNKKTGLTVSSGDADALAGAINEIIADPKLRKKLGENAKSRFEKEFKIEKISLEILNLYNEIIYGK